MLNRHWKVFGAIPLVGAAAILLVPMILELYVIYSVSVYLIMAMLALSLGLVWGMGGILSFGQSAFFGLGGYAYALLAINVGSSTWALALAIVLPTLIAALIGYFTFFGRISDIYFGVISLTFSLILYNVINSSSGGAYRIGLAPIGGYNGIPNVPPLNVPFVPEMTLDYEQFFYVVAFLVLTIYLGLRVLLTTKFGRVVCSVRENEVRAELLGYDVRLYRLAVFCIGAAIAGLAGGLYAAWGNFIDPNIFSLGFSAQIIVWVVLGGLGTLIGPMAGAAIIQAITTWLGEAKIVQPSLVLGGIFLIAVLALPQGLIPATRALWNRVHKALIAGKRTP
jgi:branched-chain amino acid transport system permease protein